MKTKIGINLDGFIEWDGGIDFIRYILQGLNREKFDIVFLVLNKDDAFSKVKNQFKSFLNIFLNKNYAINNNEFFYKKIENLIENNQILYFNNLNHLSEICIEQKVRLVLPCFNSLGRNFKIPWIGYIYDFQHKYLTSFFRENDIVSRDYNFALMNNEAQGIIVNSIQTKDDIISFLGKKSQIYVLPFTPKKIDIDKFKIESEDIIRTKYKLFTSPYFIVSNQFWSHKRHDIAIRSFIYYKDKYKTNAKLIITGKLSGLNNQDYIIEIKELIENSMYKEDIILTDYISKDDQLSLLKYSNLVIQPTNFEGGPGGGVVYEAVFFNKKCIISDINVNKEIKHPLVHFFKVNDVIELADNIYEIDNKIIKENFTFDNRLLVDTIENMIETEIGC